MVFFFRTADRYSRLTRKQNIPFYFIRTCRKNMFHANRYHWTRNCACFLNVKAFFEIEIIWTLKIVQTLIFHVASLIFDLRLDYSNQDSQSTITHPHTIEWVKKKTHYPRYRKTVSKLKKSSCQECGKRENRCTPLKLRK